ncbi:uncharacterized protein LOC121929367 [Sceloporus undulatus]|uniref:uncharacterized protein LOC121929367 n=1 Tax=Sceloporus undulatus TaxID=8520 RepID=UPI001C4D7FA8|nr:uncharacterized protein LOC121929367 [Sceloporus undulatus]
MPRPRGSYWQKEEILLLLHFVRKSGMVPTLMRSRSVPNRPIYREITRQLRERGYKRKVEQVGSKFKVMRNNFYKVLELFGGCPPRHLYPPYFGIMKRMWVKAGKPSWKHRHPNSQRKISRDPELDRVVDDVPKAGSSSHQYNRCYIQDTSTDSDENDEETQDVVTTAAANDVQCGKGNENTEETRDQKVYNDETSYIGKNNTETDTPEINLEAEITISAVEEMEEGDDLEEGVDLEEGECSSKSGTVDDTLCHDAESRGYKGYVEISDSEDESNQAVQNILGIDFTDCPMKIQTLHKAVVFAIQSQEIQNSRFMNTIVNLNKRIGTVEKWIASCHDNASNF